MANPLILILYSGSDWRKGQPFSDPKKSAAYEHFYTAAAERGIEVRRASLKWFHEDRFTKSWGYAAGQWSRLRDVVRPTLVLDKSRFLYEDVPATMRVNEAFPTVNPWELDLLATDKLLTATTFSDIVVPTYLVRTARDVERAAAEIGTTELIVKPRLGLGGSGIQIVRSDAIERATVEGLHIAQPLLDTRAGVPGLYEGVHDFRVIFAGERPILSYIRIPPEGERLANISLGATIQMVPLDALPKAVQPLLDTIVRRLRPFRHKVFSADFLFSDGTPYLVELNTKPIMYLPDHEQEQQQMHRATLEYLESVLADL